ncbi:MAG: effector protein [Vigna little leaf phytoplasma]|nr:effector protein [Vigna little leaf phytoplasma]
MIPVRNKLSFLILFFISFLTIFFMMNINPVMAMNNNQSNQSHFDQQIRILQDLNLVQARIIRRIFIARKNNAVPAVINHLINQNIELSKKIAAQKLIVHNSMPSSQK